MLFQNSLNYRTDNKCEDIFQFYSDLSEKKSLPTLEELLVQAETLIDRYSSFTAYDQALSLAETKLSSEQFPIPLGSEWSTISAPASGSHLNQPSSSTKPEASKYHEEEVTFDGDRVLANSIMFMLEYGWLTELSHAVPEGDIGRVYQIFLVCSSFLYSTYIIHSIFIALYLRFRWLDQSKLHELLPRNILPPQIRSLAGIEGRYLGQLALEYNRFAGEV